MIQEKAISNEAQILEECQDLIGYRFRDVKLLRSALTHTSGADTRLASNERLEFLGDSVLGLITCEQLFHKFPNYDEGDLTKLKSAVVSRRTCARISRTLDLGDFLFLGKGIQFQSTVPPNLLADVFESLVGAIFLDGGFDAAQEFVIKHVLPEIEREAAGAQGGNFKSILQQTAQRLFGVTPRYDLLDEQGPDHHKCFKVSAVLGERVYPSAWGRTKKEAEQKAAMNALAELNNDPIPFATN